MAYVRSYAMTAKPEATEELRAVLVALRSAVRDIPGSLGVDLMRNLDQSETFHFVERWESRDAHAAAGKMLPPGLMERLKPCLGAAPTSQNLETIM